MKTKPSIIQMLHQTREGKRRAVSPVIATLLLIAIAVAAAIVLYIFVSGLTGSLTQSGGQQVAEQISMDAYSFSPCSSSGCSTLTFTLRNVGSTTVTLSAVYFDGTLTTLTGTGAGVCVTSSTPTTLTTSGTTQTCTGTITFGSPNPAAPTPGTSHILKVTTQTGGVFTFTVIAGRSS